MMNSISVFSDSNDNSGSSCVSNLENPSPENSTTTPDVTALQRLSVNLESIFESTEYHFCSDSKIVVSDCREIPIHRCILAARSPFFKRVFFDLKEKSGKLELKDLCKDFDVGYDALGVVLGYLYSGKVKSLPREVCVCVDDECLHVGCRPVVDFMVEVLYASFTFQISEMVTLFQRRLLEILDKVQVDDILVILSVAKMCEKDCDRLVTECIHIVVKSDIDPVTLEKALPHDVVKHIMDTRSDMGLGETATSVPPDKHVRRMHRALDSDDVELVGMLLNEGHTNLDMAHALHYAVAYCDEKTTKHLLDLELADVNNTNQRGYTVLHVAARRKEPGLIASLITKGARPTDLTPDGRKALQICKRLTKSVDYYLDTEKGKDSPKDRLCIEVLEQAERKDPILGEASLSLAIDADNLRVKLLYLENRVGLARLLFPKEAQVAMDIAKVEGTSEFQLAPNLNESPFVMEEAHLHRLTALSKTVEFGKRFFPRCSDHLNKIMDAEDLSELANLGNDNAEERQVKKRRFQELQGILLEAFSKDKAELHKSKPELHKSIIPSAASSTSRGIPRTNGSTFTRKKLS